ncbi:MAG: glycosyltransferase [Actinomycetes bacterium]
MRVLFTSTAGLGHLHPLLPLMRAARAAGDDVRVAIPAGGVTAVARLGFPALPTAEPDPAETAAFWARLPEDAEAHVIGRFFGRLLVRAALPDTCETVERWRPDLVVSECAEFAGQIAAERHAVPHVTVGIGDMQLFGSTAGLLISEIDGLRQEVGLAAAGVLPWCQGTRFVTAVPPVLWSSLGSAPPGAVVYRHEDPEGFVPRPVPAPRAGRRRRVYATLGSVAGHLDRALGVYPAVLAGLARCAADVLFTVGDLDRSLLGPVPPNVHVESYVPQRVAMACDAVVTHAGSGTTVAALSRGLPIVAVPIFADQPHNAARVAALGAGLVVAPSEAAGALPAAVSRVLDERSFGDTARAIAADLRTLPEAAEVLANLRPAAVH